MKVLVITLCLMFPVVAIAQNQSMNAGDMQQMQQMMQLIQKMRQCMAQVDQARLEAIGEKSEKVGQEIEALCKAGKRKKAQKMAIAYGKKIMKDPVMVQVKKCGKITKGMLPESMPPSFEDEFDFSNKHVCDDN